MLAMLAALLIAFAILVVIYQVMKDSDGQKDKKGDQKNP